MPDDPCFLTVAELDRRVRREDAKRPRVRVAGRHVSFVFAPGVTHDVPLRELVSRSDLLDWLHHLAGKVWFDGETCRRFTRGAQAARPYVPRRRPWKTPPVLTARTTARQDLREWRRRRLADAWPTSPGASPGLQLRPPSP